MGPLARTTRDCLAVLNAIAGPDARDPYSRGQSYAAIAVGERPPLDGLRMGWSEEFLLEGVDPEIRKMTEQALEAFARWGLKLVELKLGWLRDVVAVSHVILPAEAASALEGHMHRREELGAEVRPLFEAGRLIPAVEYLQAQRVRRLLRQKAQAEIWTGCDLLLGPTTGITAPKIGEQTVSLGDGSQVEVRAASTQWVRAFNVLGVPAHAVVGGFHSNGLPMSLQVIGPALGEQNVLRTAIRFEEEMGFWRKEPEIE
jgi:aspartyl-tRNA(Asn)/glutamyl-tRNA(Gln) amidotransferase subunit A